MVRWVGLEIWRSVGYRDAAERHMAHGQPGVYLGVFCFVFCLTCLFIFVFCVLFDVFRSALVYVSVSSFVSV